MAMLAVIGDWLEGSGWTNVMNSAKVTKRGEHLVCRKVHTHLEVSGSTILQQLLCLIFSTGHVQNTVQTHQMMNNTSLMSGVRIWRRISLITGTPSYSWNSSSSSSLDHSANNISCPMWNHLQRSFRGCLLLTTITTLAG